MRLLLDTNVLIALVEEQAGMLSAPMRAVVTRGDAQLHASVASVWEIAIKVRLGKLPLRNPLGDWPSLLQDFGLHPMPIDTRHALAEVYPEPDTRDPFDRLLLAQCSVENLKLVTRDRVLAAHPLAWQPTR